LQLQQSAPEIKAKPEGLRPTPQLAEEIGAECREATDALDALLRSADFATDPWGVFMAKAFRERALLAGMPESRPTQVMQVIKDTQLRCYRFRATSSAVATTATAPGQSSTGQLDLGDRGKGIRPTSLSAAQWEEFSDAVALFQERLTAVRTFKAANTSWHAFDQYQEQLQEYERKLAAVAKEQGEIATQLQALSRGPVVQTAAAQPVRAPTVEGYFNAQLGRVITPNLAIYYIVRAVFQALYVLAGSLDQYSYTQMKQRPEQNLQSWGGADRGNVKALPHTD